MFSLCITWRGRYHWDYIRFFYTNPWCDQGHGPCLIVIHMVDLRQGKSRYRQWIVRQQIVVGTIQREGMLIPVRRRLKGQKATVVVGSGWVYLCNAQQMVGCWDDYIDAPKMALSRMVPCRDCQEQGSLAESLEGVYVVVHIIPY